MSATISALWQDIETLYNQTMRLAQLFLSAGLAALIFAALLAGWLALPRLRDSTLHTVVPDASALDSRPYLPGAWTLRLAAPRWIPLGEAGSIRLTFTPAAASAEGQEAFTDNTVVVEARAEVPAAGVSPPGLSSQTLGPGSAAHFEWRVRPQSEGTLEGRVWLYLRLVPKNGGEAVERPISLQTVTIDSVTLFGRTAREVRVIALIALSLGLVLILPYLLMRSHARRARCPSPDLVSQL